jgi:hypothetical protein
MNEEIWSDLILTIE